MAGKKRGKRVVKKKVPAKKVENVKGVISTRKKIRLVIKNLIVFAVMSVICFILARVSEKDVYIKFFKVAYAILGFVALALLIVLLILVLLRLMKK